MKKTAIVVTIAAAALSGCATQQAEVQGPPRKENIVGLAEGNVLVTFNAGQPQRVKTVGPVTGLQPGERLVGIDYRVARGVLFGLGSSGRLYTLDAKSAAAKPVGTAPLAIALAGREFGFDFNPTVDRIRIVSDSGQNMRAHPDTGAAVQADTSLAFAPGDANAGKAARVVAAGYTYNKQNEKITTNYAIDAASGSLVTQGSREGVTPAVSPNGGQLFTVGSLGIGPFASAGLDISDVNNTAYASVNTDSGRTRFYVVDLSTGKATFIGTVAGARLRGIAIEP